MQATRDIDGMTDQLQAQVLNCAKENNTFWGVVHSTGSNYRIYRHRKWDIIKILPIDCYLITECRVAVNSEFGTRR